MEDFDKKGRVEREIWFQKHIVALTKQQADISAKANEIQSENMGIAKKMVWATVVIAVAAILSFSATVAYTIISKLTLQEIARHYHVSTRPRVFIEADSFVWKADSLGDVRYFVCEHDLGFRR